MVICNNSTNLRSLDFLILSFFSDANILMNGLDNGISKIPENYDG